MAAAAQLAELVVGVVPDHLQQPRIGAEEVLPDVVAAGHRVLLVLAVHRLVHAPHQDAVDVALQQRIPVFAPDHLDHVPAGAAERRLQLLDDLAVAAHRSVEPLQVAVDHPDQVVQLLARGKRDRTERLRFVHLAVAEERPHLLRRGVVQAAVVQVAVEARLVDRHDRRQPHRHRRREPEVRHQPRVRIGGQPAAVAEFAAEVLQLPLAEAALQVGARIHAGRRVTLKVDYVAAAGRIRAAQEMVLGNLDQGGAGGERGDVAANVVGGLVGAHHHCHGVPADDRLDAALDLAAAGKRRLPGAWNGVHVRGVGGERHCHAALVGVSLQLVQQKVSAGRAAGADHVFERLDPLVQFFHRHRRCGGAAAVAVVHGGRHAGGRRLPVAGSGLDAGVDLAFVLVQHVGTHLHTHLARILFTRTPAPGRPSRPPSGSTRRPARWRRTPLRYVPPPAETRSGRCRTGSRAPPEPR